MPTDDQIRKVKTNLTNMQQFNDKMYVYGNPKIANCYVLLSQSDSSDPGLNVVKDLLTGGFVAIGSMLGPVGAFGATVLCSIVDGWGSIAPPDMSSTYASLTSRFEAASKDVDQQLAVYYQDPATYWDTVFTYNGQTCTLGDLATIDFPAETDPNFEILLDPAVFGVDQGIWKTNLVSYCYNVRWSPDVHLSSHYDIVDWCQMFIGKHPSYQCDYYWHQDTGDCGDSSYNNVTEYNISFGAGRYHDGAIGDSACAYLFIDSTAGTTINANGLYTRNTVFTGLGIPTTSVYTSTMEKAEKPSFGYLRAVAEEKPTLSRLEAEVGMEGIKDLLREAVEKDPTLRSTLQTRPHQAIAEALGVAVPEVLDFTVIVEGPQRHGLVIPWDGKNPSEDT
jgi:hypothetical protein